MGIRGDRKRGGGIILEIRLWSATARVSLYAIIRGLYLRVAGFRAGKREAHETYVSVPCFHIARGAYFGLAFSIRSLTDSWNLGLMSGMCLPLPKWNLHIIIEVSRHGHRVIGRGRGLTPTCCATCPCRPATRSWLG